MIMPEVYVLVDAMRTDSTRHKSVAAWLRRALEGPETVGLSELVLSGAVRVLTHPQVFSPPTPPALAVEFASAMRTSANVVALRPGERHWEIFASLCTGANAKGNLVADAYHAALAIENGATWVTTDRDFARFPGLRWRHPLE